MLVRGLDGSMRSKAKEACHVILSQALKGEDWQLGHTKVFLKVGYCYNVYANLKIRQKQYEERILL